MYTSAQLARLSTIRPAARTAAMALPTGTNINTGLNTGATSYNIDSLGRGWLSGANGGGLFGGGNALEGFSSIAQGLASLGSLYTAFQGIGLAKDQLALQKKAFNTNLANQRQTYNTSLEDTIRARYATEGRSAEEAQSYLDTHKL